MSWEAWFTLFVIFFVFVELVRGRVGADLILLGGMIVLIIAGVISGTQALPGPNDAISGLGNAGLVTVAALFVVVAGLVQTGAMSIISNSIIGRPTNLASAQIRIMAPVAIMSAFLNNTPVVAMFMPVVDDVCKKANISPSKLFLPLAYAATFGGVCTLIGTSTNLIVNGMLGDTGLPVMKMFDLAWVGVPCAIGGLIYMILIGNYLLPDRKPPIDTADDPRNYTVEMTVVVGGALVGQTIEKAGLRQLPQLYLVEIDRDGEVIHAVGPRETLVAGDNLVFVGVVESIVDLQKIRGLAPATDQIFKLDGARSERCLVEAVVSRRCPLIGKTIRDGKFRSVYDAAVIAVARGGKRVLGKIGDIELRMGDTLLMEAHPEFIRRQRNNVDFFLVSGVENSIPLRHERSYLAIAILIAMIVVATAGIFDMLTAALVAAACMILSGCCTGSEARRSIDWSLLLVIAASLGIGKSIEQSGLALEVANSILQLANKNPWLALLAVYFITTFFTEIITNNAAAIMVFPIAYQTSQILDVNFMPFVVAITIGASASFATPIGYQTNLMVYGPGGYRFTDYLKVGIPLNLLFMLITVLLTPLIWPF